MGGIFNCCGGSSATKIREVKSQPPVASKYFLDTPPPGVKYAVSATPVTVGGSKPEVSQPLCHKVDPEVINQSVLLDAIYGHLLPGYKTCEITDKAREMTNEILNNILQGLSHKGQGLHWVHITKDRENEVPFQTYVLTNDRNNVRAGKYWLFLRVDPLDVSKPPIVLFSESLIDGGDSKAGSGVSSTSAKAEHGYIAILAKPPSANAPRERFSDQELYAIFIECELTRFAPLVQVGTIEHKDGRRIPIRFAPYLGLNLATDKTTLRVEHFRQIVYEFKKLHEHGISHGDVRISNFCILNEIIFCIDFSSISTKEKHHWPTSVIDAEDPIIRTANISHKETPDLPINVTNDHVTTVTDDITTTEEQMFKMSSFRRVSTSLPAGDMRVLTAYAKRVDEYQMIKVIIAKITVDEFIKCIKSEYYKYLLQLIKDIGKFPPDSADSGIAEPGMLKDAEAKHLFDMIDWSGSSNRVPNDDRLNISYKELHKVLMELK